MNVFISQPMNGLTDAEIVTVREKIFDEFKLDHPEAVLLDHYADLKSKVGIFNSYTHSNVALLAESLRTMADADVVLFAKDWEKARGCRIENKVAGYYDIERVYVR